MFVSSKKITLLLLAIVLSACSSSSKKEEQPTSSKKADWLLIKENMGKFDNVSSFTFLDKDMNITKNVKTETGQDIAYKYYDIENNMYYKSGPGGLVSINIKTKEVKHIIKDKNINNVYIDNDKIYYYENVGQVDNHYQVNICELGTESCLKLPYFVNGFIVNDDTIYVVNAKENDDRSIIQIYKNKKLEKEIHVNDSGTFYRYHDSIYYLMMDGLLDVDSEKFMPFIDTNGKPIQLESTFDAFYPSSTNTYFISHFLDSLKMYSVKKIESGFRLNEINLELPNIINYEFDGKNTFTFLDKERQFYSYNTITNTLEKLNIPLDDLNSSLLKIS